MAWIRIRRKEKEGLRGFSNCFPQNHLILFLSMENICGFYAEEHVRQFSSIQLTAMGMEVAGFFLKGNKSVKNENISFQL